MKTKAELFAFFGECLAAAAIIWIFAASFIMIDEKTPPPGVLYVLLMTLAAALLYVTVLRRGAAVRVLAVLFLMVFAAEITAFILLYEDRISFRYVLSAVLMAGVSAFASLYLCTAKQKLAKHLTFIDSMIAALVWLVVFHSAARPDPYSTLCVIAVTLLNVAAAIGLRMSEEGMTEGIGKAFALAAASSAAAAGIIYILVKLFSRSGRVTGAALAGIKGFFVMFGALIGRFLDWLTSLLPESDIGALPEETAQQAAAAEEIAAEEIPLNPVIPAVIIAAVIVVAAILIIRKYSKKRIRLSLNTSFGGSTVRSRRKKGAAAARWRRFAESIRFRFKALLERNTPPGVLVWLERKALKKKMPRSEGETIREFASRLAPGGLLDPLACDLERRFYGGAGYSLSARDCRTIRRDMKKLLKG